MDALASLLDHVRADRAVFTQSILDPRWAVDLTTDASLVLVVVAQGAIVVDADGDTAAVRAGDAAVLAGASRFTLKASAAAEPPVGGPATGVDWPAVTECLVPCSGDPDGPAVVVTGAYHAHGPTAAPLLAALPTVAVVREQAGELCPAMDLLYAELGRDRPGQRAILDRLLDLLLLSTLREWFDQPGVDPPAGYRALGDPIVGPALRAMEERPGHPWTVVGLATHAGVSRATFARRFADLVGRPPIAHLTAVRLTRAADLLRRTEMSIDAIARRVGYEGGDALAVAFKRVHGTSPGAYRSQPDTQITVGDGSAA